jgi:GNAT superfamily N-acetyltransferase
MIATRPLGGDVWEICRVYVDPSLHGGGLGHALLDVAEAHAMAQGAVRLVLWSDTRFERAHRFYEKRSYVRDGPIRVLHDISASLEFGYAKPVNGFERLDIAAAASAAGLLSELLIVCVESGAAVSFVPPMRPEKGLAFWRRVSSEVGAGTRVLVAGWRDGALVATGMLDLALAENQPHCAEVQKIMVHPSARRTGLGRAVLRALEQHAMACGRSLLMLDTRAGDAGEALYRAEGWHETGRIPDHALGPGGRLYATVFFWKRISR